MVSVRGMTKEVKSNLWVHRRWLDAARGGKGGWKVAGSQRGDRYYTLVFHGHVWGVGACIQGRCVQYVDRVVFTRELLLSIFILKNTQDQSVLTKGEPRKLNEKTQN
jgi:hypothetical protein